MTETLDIHSIHDNEGESFDRYTIVLNEMHNAKYNACIGLSSDPDSLLGYSQFGSCTPGSHLGKKLTFDQLPENIQKHIKFRLTQGD